ncbi:MAG: ABC transporter ATP-binding protein [Lachnospiraceae bacterium]|nr:ABC transporter ATP-binding protein [Lachnospiraceae bacterium]
MQSETTKKIMIYIKKYWFLVMISIVFAAVSVVTTLYLPILTGDAIDCMISRGKVDFALLKPIFEKMLIVLSTTGLSQWLMNVCNNRITYLVMREIRNDAFDKIQSLPLKYLDGHPSGDIVSRVIADVDQFADGLLLGFTQAFTSVLTIVGTLVFMLRLNVWITLVVVLVTPLSFFVAAFIAKRTHRMFRKQSEIRGEQTAFIDEMIGNQRVVQAYSYEEKAVQRFDDINERLEKCSLQATFFSSTVNPATRFVNNLVYAGVGVVGAFIVLRGGISVGQLSCFLSYANQYTKPFNEISGVITELQNAIACAARIFALIDEEAQTPDAETPVKPESIRGQVDFDNVSFSYVPEQPLIRNLNLSVKPGQRVAIVGPTGCGKTTLINLLMRFYDVNEGRILIDGTDIYKMTRGDLRTSFGMVLQDTWIKDGTIHDNISMGKPDAGREEVIAAAKATHAHSFIRRLPNGYDTVVKEDGDSLSQGQKQLLSITRIMLSKPVMLILDEATSSIDTRTEIRIQRAFAKLMVGRTSFIVAHRLSTIENADIILVMKDGNIIEQGNHESLMAAGGFYSELYNSQYS